MSDDGYIKEMRLQTSRGFSKLCFQILKSKNINKYSLQKIKAIGSLPLSGTFLFRIPRHHENAQELKSLILRTFRTFLLFTGAHHKASRRLIIFSRSHRKAWRLRQEQNFILWLLVLCPTKRTTSLLYANKQHKVQKSCRF